MFLIENDIIGSKGRISKADLPYDSQNPIFFRKMQICRTVNSHFHVSVLHNGAKDTLNELRY